VWNTLCRSAATVQSTTPRRRPDLAKAPNAKRGDCAHTLTKSISGGVSKGIAARPNSRRSGGRTFHLPYNRCMSFSVSRREFVSAIGAASLLTARGYSSTVGANDRLRMAVIGAGVMATEHMESLVKAREIDNLEIVNVCDVYQKRLETAVHLTNAKPVQDYRRILDSKDIDWVLIATPEHCTSKWRWTRLMPASTCTLRSP
jgi:hypothetical protein